MLRQLARDDRGAVTAEFAAALPAVVLTIVLSVGALQAGSLQLRLTDAAGQAARSLGRGEATGVADSGVGALVGEHSFSATTSTGFVCVTVSAPVSVGGSALLGVRVSATSCAPAGGL